MKMRMGGTRKDDEAHEEKAEDEITGVEAEVENDKPFAFDPSSAVVAIGRLTRLLSTSLQVEGRVARLRQAVDSALAHTARDVSVRPSLQATQQQHRHHHQGSKPGGGGDGSPRASTVVSDGSPPSSLSSPQRRESRSSPPSPVPSTRSPRSPVGARALRNAGVKGTEMGAESESPPRAAALAKAGSKSQAEQVGDSLVNGCGLLSRQAGGMRAYNAITKKWYALYKQDKNLS